MRSIGYGNFTYAPGGWELIEVPLQKSQRHGSDERQRTEFLNGLFATTASPVMTEQVEILVTFLYVIVT
jgi:hypothetical protein